MQALERRFYSCGIIHNICRFTHWRNPSVIQHIIHTSTYASLLCSLDSWGLHLTSSWLWDDFCIWKHTPLICPSTGGLNSLSGTARLSSQEFIPQQIATLWIASFLLFWASAIFFLRLWLITNITVCSWLAAEILNREVLRLWTAECAEVSQAFSRKQGQEYSLFSTMHSCPVFCSLK